nr:sensor histidine kinase [Cucumibacter marinus]
MALTDRDDRPAATGRPANRPVPVTASARASAHDSGSATADGFEDAFEETAEGGSSETTRRRRPAPRQIPDMVWRGLRRVLAVTIFSSLTRRIVFLNLAALVALVGAVLYLNDFRAGLIDARVQSLRTQGEIIAGAIASSATIDSDVITINPDRFLQLQGDEPVSSFSFFDPTLEFPINPERVAPLLRNLVTPTGTRARIYDRNGFLILDSENIFARGEVLSPEEQPEPERNEFFLSAFWNQVFRWLGSGDYPTYQEYGPDEGKRYPEVATAFDGRPAAIVRVNQTGRLVVSVAVPINRLRANVGVLLLSTQPGDIDDVVEAERWSIVRVALVAAVITTLVSLFMAGTIAGPMRRLSAAAKRVQAARHDREQIPDFSERTDEIGDLSGSLRDMTNALYARIDAIERFAADVAHELKNPLTSLRSAVETLPLARTPADRERLADIIQHDVRRLDRLISDISSASRLDAELAREDAEPVDLGRLLETIVAIQTDLATSREVTIDLDLATDGKDGLWVEGHDVRLGQVFTNLIDNAVSFSPENSTVSVAASRKGDMWRVTVSDEGPGITGEADKVFARFYTDRPESEGFGNHSGLGLSISRQIVEAHGGTIIAGNRSDRSGAVFTVELPRAGA